MSTAQPPAAPRSTARGQATRARLLQAARDVVAQVGYSHATTKAIAEAAGVAEGTIYRHFPDKVTLFLAAATDANAPTIAHLSQLPARAGTRTVEENLTDALTRLAGLREHMLPLELAILTDPELTAQRNRAIAASTPSWAPGGHTGPGPDLPKPHEIIADYLAAEQQHGRIRADVDPLPTAVSILAALFGLALIPPTDPATASDARMVSQIVDLLIRGLHP